MIFKKKGKRKEQTSGEDDWGNLSMYDMLVKIENTIDQKLEELERLKSEGKVSEEEYWDKRQKLEEVKRKTEYLRSGEWMKSDGKKSKKRLKFL